MGFNLLIRGVSSSKEEGTWERRKDCLERDFGLGFDFEKGKKSAAREEREKGGFLETGENRVRGRGRDKRGFFELGDDVIQR